MLKLYPSLENSLNQLAEDYRNKVLVWFASAQEPVDATTKTLARLVDTVHASDATVCYEALSTLSAEDRIRYSLINEFGHNVLDKPISQPIIQYVAKHLKK
jgi:hypothetical protein